MARRGDDSGGRVPFRALVAGRIAALWLEAQCATWRVEMESAVQSIDARFAAGRKFILAFWHGKYPPLLVLLRDRRACIFSSVSFRGAVISEICRHFGYECVRIPDGGGDASLSAMKEALVRHSGAGIAVDGPLGPYHAVKRGPLQLASATGFEIVPASVASSPKRVASERWDRMEMPALFSRVRIETGEPLRVPPLSGGDDLETWSRRLREALDDVDRRAEAGLAEMLRRA